MTERPDPAKVIPGPDPGACPSCGEWRKSGMIHNCGNDPAKVIAEALARNDVETAGIDHAEDVDAFYDEQGRVVLAALAAAGFPVGERAAARQRTVAEIVKVLRGESDVSRSVGADLCAEDFEDAADFIEQRFGKGEAGA